VLSTILLVLSYIDVFKNIIPIYSLFRIWHVFGNLLVLCFRRFRNYILLFTIVFVFFFLYVFYLCIFLFLLRSYLLRTAVFISKFYLYILNVVPKYNSPLNKYLIILLLLSNIMKSYIPATSKRISAEAKSLSHEYVDSFVEENVKKENGLKKSSPVNIEGKPIILSYADAVRKN